MEPHLTHYRQNQLAHTLLSADEERKLLERASGGDAAAVEQLVESNQRLVMSLALKYFTAGMTGDLDLLDLVQYGNLGLLEAIQRWDPRKKVRLSTYATWWIRAIVRRAGFTRGNTVARSVRQGEQLFKIYRTRGVLHTRLGRDPHPGEIADASGLSQEVVDSVMPLLATSLSMDYETDDRPALFDIIPAGNNTAGDVERSLIEARVQDAISDLPPDWRRVLELRYGILEDNPVSFSEIGRRLDITRTQAQEINRLALRRLRAVLRDLAPGD